MRKPRAPEAPVCVASAGGRAAPPAREYIPRRVFRVRHRQLQYAVQLGVRVPKRERPVRLRRRALAVANRSCKLRLPLPILSCALNRRARVEALFFPVARAPLQPAVGNLDRALIENIAAGRVLDVFWLPPASLGATLHAALSASRPVGDGTGSARSATSVVPPSAVGSAPSPPR